jgi:polyisoprenoid-binding protein YceI
VLRTLALATALLTTPVLADAAEWSVDSVHSTASFTVKHMMVSTVRGAFGKMSGTVSWSKPDCSDARVDVTIDATTIDTRDSERDDHLRSPDFFDVKRFPTLTFKSKRVEKSKQKGHVVLVGDLTIHGVTKEVAFDAMTPTAERKTPYGTIAVGAEARAKINRRDFGLNWNQALEAGGVLVSDEVNLDINLELSKKAN